VFSKHKRARSKQKLYYFSASRSYQSTFVGLNRKKLAENLLKINMIKTLI